MKGKKTGGRKKGSINKSTQDLKALIDSCVDFKEVFKKLYELTQGVEAVKFSQDGEIVYTQPPDSAAAKILIEHRFGKAAQSVELKGDSAIGITIFRKIIGNQPQPGTDLHSAAE